MKKHNRGSCMLIVYIEYVRVIGITFKYTVEVTVELLS